MSVCAVDSNEMAEVALAEIGITKLDVSCERFSSPETILLFSVDVRCEGHEQRHNRHGAA